MISRPRRDINWTIRIEQDEEMWGRRRREQQELLEEQSRQRAARLRELDAMIETHRAEMDRASQNEMQRSISGITQAFGNINSPMITNLWQTFIPEGLSSVETEKPRLYGMTERDTAGIIRMLDGHDHGLTDTSASLTTGRFSFRRRYVRTSQGGFDVLMKLDKCLVVNLDHGTLISHERLNQLRQDIIGISDLHRKSLPIVTVGETALSRIGGLRSKHVYEDMRFVARTGMESVFRLDGKYYLSAYDEQESPPLYFLCQLPGKVDSVESARESLKPKSVLAAERAGLEVRRQGDLFAIRSSLTDAEALKLGVEVEPSNKAAVPTPVLSNMISDWDPWQRDMFFGVMGRSPSPPAPHGLYGTAHVPTRTIRTPQGMELAKGMVVHKPPGRKADHKPLDLCGDTWWWIARNTVPIQR